MDQKHAMLYPPLDPNRSGMQPDQRLSASAAIGLPTQGAGEIEGRPAEAPPSYDMAMAAGSGPGSGSNSGPSTSSGAGWAMPSAPAATPHEPFVPRSPQSPPQAPTNYGAVIVEQPLPSGAPAIDAANRIPAKLGPNPCAVTCPACGSCRTTRMSFTPNARTHLSAMILCLVGWCCCACCVPYCMNSCRTGNHYCAKCNTFLGTFSPRGLK